jgi:hypothetical protein
MMVMTSRGLSTRAAARGLGLSRSVEHCALKQPGTDAKLSGRIRDLSQQFPRFGYRRVAAWLNVGDKRLWLLWSRMGLALPSSRLAVLRNGTMESFNGKLRDECLNREWFVSVRDARVLIEQWRSFYNHQRPHSALGY